MNSKKEQLKMREEYKELQIKRWGTDEKMVDYCTKEKSRFVRLSSGHLLAIEKPSIETRFCFGYSDSAYDTEDYDQANDAAYRAGKDEEYFKAQNLQQLQETIDTLNGEGKFKNNIAYIWYSEDGEAALKFCRRWKLIEENLEELNEQDRKAIIAAYEIEITAFEKRLNTYLKRYGMSKIDTWSYWRDA